MMFSPVWTSNVMSLDPVANHYLKFALFMDLLPVVNCVVMTSNGTGQCSSVTWKSQSIPTVSRDVTGWGSSCKGKTTLPQPKPACYPPPYSVPLTSHSDLTLFNTISLITSPFPILSHHTCHSFCLRNTPAKCP